MDSQLYVFIAKLVKRLDERKRLLHSIQGMPLSETHTVNELKTVQNCFPQDQGPSSQFACLGINEGGVFNCSHFEVPFSCENFYTSMELNCNSDVGYACDEVFVFSCLTFMCDGYLQGASFHCQASQDFTCTGPEYICADNNECETAHIFLCSNQFSCIENDTCSGGAPCTVPNNNDFQCNSSTPYERGGDTSPGDFVCGWGDGSKEHEQFSCAKQFACNSYDEFQCESGTTQFNCGTGLPNDSFSCQSDDIFECEHSYNCSSSESVNCSGSDNNYNCTCIYSICPSDSVKECYKTFQCINSQHSCPGSTFHCNPSYQFAKP